ncbi:MAG: rhodanese-like domain-containing protein [Candidatus Hodarchaeota archaeon]
MNRRKTCVFLVISVGIVLFGAYFAVSQLQPRGITYGDVTIEQAAELVVTNPSLVLLDVRTDWEFDSGHLKGAVNIPIDELEQRIGELNSNERLLVYCRTGNRSRRAVQILLDNGFSKLYHMSAGITAWMDAGYPVSTD